MTSLVYALLLFTPLQIRAPLDSTRVARDIVAKFYTWYVPASQKPDADTRALGDARWHFDPTLARELRADRAAARASKDEIVGLDMDPYLNSQDPCERYAPSGVRRDGKDFLVDVKGSGNCGTHTTVDVTVRVRFQGTTPVFVNFLYPGPTGDSLDKLLRTLAADRAKNKPRKGH